MISSICHYQVIIPYVYPNVPYYAWMCTYVCQMFLIIQPYIHDSMAENLEFVNKSFEFSNETVQVIKDSFGPNGLDVLLSTTSGTLMMTNDGFQVLKSLSQGNPVGKLIFQGLELFYKNTGDFSKKFILLIGELLANVLNVISEDKTRQSEQLLCISQGMNELFYGVIPKVFDDLQTTGFTCECTGKIDDVQSCVISIMKTSVSGKFSSTTCDALIGLLQQLLFVTEELSRDVAHLKQATEKLLDNYSETVWEVPGKPLTSSTVLHGIIIPREFLTMTKELPHMKENNSLNFVILGSSLVWDLPQSATVLVLSDSEHINTVFEWKRKQIENIMKVIAKHSVELIVTSLALNETFVHICNQHNIAAIHLIPQKDLTRISNVFRISPLHDLEGDLTSFIGTATSCKPIQVGHHVYVHLEPTKLLVQQIMLYAPTEALCRQYSIAMQNVLKVVKSSFKELPDKSCLLSYVSCGGAFELVLVYALEEYKKANKLSPNIQLACDMLENALLSIPRQLVKNSSNRELSIFHLKAESRQALLNGKQVFGLGKNGKLRAARNEEFIEPTMANYMLISSVLQLFVQILRTDKVICVKTLPRNNLKVDSDDSDSEVDE